MTGASSGIGKATSKLFQEKGWNVIATMRTPEKEEELVKLDNVMVTRLDVLDTTSIKGAVDAGIEKFGKIDVLLNNAGYGAYGPLEAFDMDGIRRQSDTNVIGLLAVTKTVLPHMRTNKTGVIVNVSSIGGKMTFPLGTLYHGTKFAVEGLSEALLYELDPIGIKMKIIEPGAIQTDFVGRSFDFRNNKLLTEYQPVIQNMLATFSIMSQGSSPAQVVAEVIYKAATDGTGQLRYTAGEDARKYMTDRKAMDDETFIDSVKLMGL